MNLYNFLLRQKEIACYLGRCKPKPTERQAMTDEDKTEMLDSIWTEVRQLVLNDGPATEAIDEMLASQEIPEEKREAFIAQCIAFHCAQVTCIAPGPLQGTPPAFIFNTWAKWELDSSLRRGG